MDFILCILNSWQSWEWGMLGCLSFPLYPELEKLSQSTLKTHASKNPLYSNMSHFKVLTIIMSSMSRFRSISTSYVFENTSKKYTLHITSIKIQVWKIHYVLCTVSGLTDMKKVLCLLFSWLGLNCLVFLKKNVRVLPKEKGSKMSF